MRGRCRPEEVPSPFEGTELSPGLDSTAFQQYIRTVPTPWLGEERSTCHFQLRKLSWKQCWNSSNMLDLFLQKILRAASPMTNYEELKISETKILDPPIAVGSFHVVLPFFSAAASCFAGSLFLGLLAVID